MIGVTDIPVETISDRKGRREIKIKRYLMGDEKTTKIIVCVCVCVDIQVKENDIPRYGVKEIGVVTRGDAKVKHA